MADADVLLENLMWDLLRIEVRKESLDRLGRFLPKRKIWSEECEVKGKQVSLHVNFILFNVNKRAERSEAGWSRLNLDSFFLKPLV